ncbi:MULTISPECIES: SRPBCC family protein [Saliphagus]|uniref:SRPBCC family protein n=1 Tax=Saliphagus infecundisoli TaxID=1849069 RepID=A0ABD5Q9J1_9EURY|nr:MULTISPECIES: SRPBCC family protein [Saliphagus]
MATYERETRIRAPLERVWEFHSRVSGLETLTPAWMELRVESVIGPDGEREPAVLDVGSEITLSIRPGGVGPRQHWTSVITEREREDGVAYFRDEMVDGPFDRWVHTHSFFADGRETVCRDRVEYELPSLLGPLGERCPSVTGLGFEPMFRGRHAKAKAVLERE